MKDGWTASSQRHLSSPSLKKSINLCEDTKSKFYNAKFRTIKNCRESFQTIDELLVKHGNPSLFTN